MSTNDWQEAGSNTESWKPENEGDSIQGLLVAVKDNVGINNSKVYMIEQEGAEEATSVWGSTVLDTKFQEITIGSEVRIEYLGEQKGKGPKPYKNYKVLYKPAPKFEN